MRQREDCLGDAVNSRNDERAAGWNMPPDEDGVSTRHWSDRLDQRLHPKWDSFSWLTVRALYESINDVFAKAGPTIVRGRRARWVAAQRAAGVERAHPSGPAGWTGGFAPDLVVDRRALGRPRFILMGDPGEADASQYAVVDPLLAVHAEQPTDFMVIVSDVVYPAGDINEYVNAFYLPYREYDRPIYALPGNHDWYDGLNGFMFNFCAAEPLPPVSYRRQSYGPGERAALLLWRGAERPDRDMLVPWIGERARRAAGEPAPRRRSNPAEAALDPPPGAPDIDGNEPPPAPGRRPGQPAPYFAIDTGPLLIVAIDTGVASELDGEQGEWLRRVSARPKPKLLLTGKPIYVNNEYHPCQIVWKEASREARGPQPQEARQRDTVDDIVRQPDHQYLAAVGGDVHNYQRYPVRLRDGRTIHYFVSGGGGAYLSATHSIPKVGPTCEQRLPADVEGFDEADFRCYPLRGDSLTLYTRSAGPLLFKLICSAPVLIASALLMMLVVLGELDDRRAPVLLGAFGGVLILGAVVGGFAARDTVIASTTAGYRALLFGGAAVLFGLGVAALMLEYGDAEANSAAGIALGVPFVLVAGVALAYTLRGYRPEYAPTLLVVAPLIALWEIFKPFGLDGGWELLVYVFVPILMLICGVWVTRRAMERLPRETFLKGHRIGVVVTWSLLTLKILSDQASPGLLRSQDWLTWTMVVLVATGLVVGWLIPLFTPHPHRPNQSDRSALRDAATNIVWLALIVLALHALAQLGDGWPAQVTALAFSTFAGIAGLLLLGALLALIHGNPQTIWHMAKGRVSPGFVANHVADHIGGEQPVRPVGSDDADQDKRGMVRAVRRLGKLVSEIAESNEPPFYKSFLTVDVEDDELVIRCYGVTGYTVAPTLEDCVSIPLTGDRRQAT